MEKAGPFQERERFGGHLLEASTASQAGAGQEAAGVRRAQCRKESGPYPTGSYLKGSKQRRDLDRFLEKSSGQLGGGGWKGERLRIVIQAQADGRPDQGLGQ